MNAGGSQIEISENGVFITTAGKFEAKASEHKFEGGESLSQKKYNLPKVGMEEYKGKYCLYKDDGSPYVQHEYRIYDENKNILDEGVTNELGETNLVVTEKEETISFDIKHLKKEEYLDDSWLNKFKEKFNELNTIINEENI